MDGIGKYYADNGDEYEGEMKNNKIEGYGRCIRVIVGVMVYANKDKYEGSFENWMRNGKGTMIYANGDKYTGEWKLNNKDGEGTL